MKYTVGASSTIYPTANYNVKGTEKTKHIFAGGQLIGTISGSGAGAVAHSVATDHLTGSNVVTSSAGVVEELADYYPYGEVRLDEKAGTFSEQRKYAGQELDTDTGLSYMNARYYSGKTGRFVSQDPMALYSPEKLLGDPQSLNSYAYARNNPMRYVDPSGMIVETPWDVGNVIYDVGGIVKNTIEVNAGLVNYGYGVLTGNQARQNRAMNQMGTDLDDLGWAIVDTAFDSGATVVPFVPAGVTKAVRKSGDIRKIANQVHHIATNKSKAFTNQFKKITDKYGLKLDGDWNKVLMEHAGRHANKYHEYILQEMQIIDEVAKGSTETFLKMYESVKDTVKNTPSIIGKDFWKDK